VLPLTLKRQLARLPLRGHGPSKMVKLWAYLELSSTHADDHAADLARERWSSMVIFRQFPSSHGTETEQGTGSGNNFDT
jgi:hypothetical protein